MYHNKIAAVIKCQNKPVLEKGNSFFLPINSTFSVFIKNLHDKKAFVKVYVNGKSVTPDHIEMHKKDRISIFKYQDTNHTFRFIENSREIQSAQGTNIEDGLVRIEVSFEKEGLISRLKNTPYQKEDAFKQEKTYPWDHATVMFKGGNSSTQEMSSNFSGKIVPGKIDQAKDNLTTHALNSQDKVDESFTIILEIHELLDDLVEPSKTKKVCPSCQKKFKHTFLYCPYDGTFLSNS